MTRNEAIRIWRYVKDHPTYDGDIVPIIQEACDMAIKALEQEPSGDLIQRQAAIDIVDSYSESPSNVEDVTQDIISDIVVLPSVNPQEPSRDMEEIEEVINCDTDAEIKLKMISNIVCSKPHYFETSEPRYCDRNICLKNEYNGIGCDECEVTKSQEPTTVIATGDGAYYHIKALSQKPKTDYKVFAEWVSKEIFDDNWEYNKDAFAEIACRKLAKLGIVRAKGDEWELVEPQENCDNCKHKDDKWDSEHCDGCCGNHSGFEPQESEVRNDRDMEKHTRV